MTISLSQALKEKNRIAGELKKLWELVQTQNSIREDNTRSINVHDTMQRIELCTDKLIEIKTKIGIANKGILDKIIRMEEIKSMISNYRLINTNEVPDYITLKDGCSALKRNAAISAKDVLEKLDALQIQCSRIQDELDAYNAAAKIEFDTPRS